MGTTRITNVILDNRKLAQELEAAHRKIEELTRVQQSLGELKHTLRGSQVSQTDMHLLSALINKVPVAAESPKKAETSELPSVKLFKRMTTLKMEKTELEIECA